MTYIRNLICDFHERIPTEKYFDAHEAAWETCVIYDRIGFIMKQDKKIQKEIESYHSATLAKMYLLIHGLLPHWKKRGRSDHPYFQEFALLHLLSDKKIRKNVIDSLKASQSDVYDESGTLMKDDALNSHIDSLINKTKSK